MIQSHSFLIKRPRRNRKSAAIRDLVQENHLLTTDLVAPYFVCEGKSVRSPISSLPSHFHLSEDHLLEELEELHNLGIRALMLFPVVPPKYKDPTGSYAHSEENHLARVIEKISTQTELSIIVDVALDPFTTHGHDGLLSENGQILNDETIVVLEKMSLLYAQAGADVIAPSDMMDGRIGALRQALDSNGFKDTSLMSYTAKYASSFYAPFRHALNSTPSFGNKKGYQMNPANAKEALLEAALDEQEGADFLMVKPASMYLDILHRIREKTNLPLVAYHVSGEYAMLKAAAQQGWLDYEKALFETLLCIKRAGADIIITYGAKELARLFRTSTELQHREPTDK